MTAPQPHTLAPDASPSDCGTGAPVGHVENAATAVPQTDPHQQALNDAWQSAAQADHHAQLNARIQNVEPLLDIIEQSERMMRHMAREDISYLPADILDHHDQLTQIAHRCLAMRKTLYQLHNATPTPGSAGVPPAIKNAPSDCSAGAPAGLSNCSAGAPAGHSDKGTISTPTNATKPSPSCAPQGRRPVATGEALQSSAQPVDPVPNSFRAPEGHRNTTPAPSAIPDSSFPIHKSPQRAAPIPPIPPLPHGFTDPNPQNPHTPLNYPTPRSEADIETLMKTLDTLRTANLAPNPASRSAASTPSVASVASVPTIPTIPSIPTIPFTKLQATAQKLYRDVMTLTRNQPHPTPNPPRTQHPAPSTPPHAGARSPHNATDNTMAPVTGVSRPTAGHTTVTDAPHPTPANPPGNVGTGSAPSNHNPHANPRPGAVPVPRFPRFPDSPKVWKGRDSDAHGGLEEGRGNFSKLPLPSPSSPIPPANERPPP